MMTHADCLIPGDELLEKHPDFVLTGRKKSLARLQAILMRSRSNNALIVGPGGAGASALCMGLESTKNDEETPLDIVRKRKFWLDTDALFASGDMKVINETFRKLTLRLARTSQSVLIVDDFNDFIEAARSNGCTNLINTLMRDIKAGKYQAILESRDENLDAVIKCHSDMREIFTLMDLKEPEGKDLEDIIHKGVGRLEKYHGIKVSEEAIEAAIEVTTKYRANDASLSRAQPERTLTLIDRALTTYRQISHSKAPGLEELEARLLDVKKAKVGDETASNDMKSRGKAELDSLQSTLESEIEDTKQAWDKQKKKIRGYHSDQVIAEKRIREMEDEIDAILEQAKQEAAQARQEANHKEGHGRADSRDTDDFLNEMREGGYEPPRVKELRAQIREMQELAQQSKNEYDAMMAEINKDLLLTKRQILQKFSDLSGIPANRLDEDEVEKLKALAGNLKQRVFDQDPSMDKIANAIKSARVGLVDSDKPMGAFMFLGPTGVGKTEAAKATALEFFGDGRSLLRLDMSEYQEKHAVARLIGSPPGYEGFEAGGILTNAMRVNPRRVVLFDEIEKAHPDVFDTCLQILDDARLTDNLGRTCSFSDAIIICTSNIGGLHFLNEDISYEEAVELATKELDSKFRPEFLARFNGRRNIDFFRPLSLSAVEKIVAREISKKNVKIAPRGLELQMSDEDLQAMCADLYDPYIGARGIKGVINDFLDANLTGMILGTPDAKGVMVIRYDRDIKSLNISRPASNDPLAARPSTLPNAASEARTAFGGDGPKV